MPGEPVEPLEQPVVRVAVLADGVMGLWDEATRTVWLDAGLTAVERRCTLVHELVHAERGDVPCGDAVLDARQEARVEREAARRLVSLEALVDAARWSRDLGELAELLDVDEGTLVARIASLAEAERAALGGAGLR